MHGDPAVQFEEHTSWMISSSVSLAFGPCTTPLCLSPSAAHIHSSRFGTKVRMRASSGATHGAAFLGGHFWTLTINAWCTVRRRCRVGWSSQWHRRASGTARSNRSLSQKLGTAREAASPTSIKACTLVFLLGRCLGGLLQIVILKGHIVIPWQTLPWQSYHCNQTDVARFWCMYDGFNCQQPTPLCL